MVMTGHPLEEVEELLKQSELYDESGEVTGIVATFRAIITAFQGNLTSSRAFSKQALALLPENSYFLRGMVADNLGVLDILVGDLPAAEQALQELVRVSQMTGNVLIAVGALCNLAGIYMLRGQLRQAERTNRRALKLATDDDGRHLPIAGKALLGLGELAREWNYLDAADRFFTEAITLMQRYGEIGAIIGYLSLARVRQSQADLTEAQKLTDKARELATRFDTTEMDDRLVDAYQVILWLAQDNVPAASRWLEKSGLVATTPDGEIETRSSERQLDEAEKMTVARILLAQGRSEDARIQLNSLLQVAEKLSRRRSLVKILALLSLAYEAQADSEQALAVLARALRLAEPEGFIRSFVDEGEPMARLLYKASVRKIFPAYTGRLLAAFPKTRPESHSGAPGSMVEPLSPRELEVLALLNKGLSNREIAGQLFLSLSTVKGHTSSIYSKLAVNNRTQAVTKARQLGILNDR
jgi:LuxR family maltose regulon positive regulatory protein